MTKFLNAYHFVPLEPAGKQSHGLVGRVWDALPTVETFNAGTLGHLAHDRWHQECLSGRIVCDLTVETPLVIGADQTKLSQGKSAASVVSPFMLDGAIAIPGTSLRGMLSALVEAASGSAMRVLGNLKPLSFRMVARDAFRHVGILIEDKGRFLIQPCQKSHKFPPNCAALDWYLNDTTAPDGKTPVALRGPVRFTFDPDECADRRAKRLPCTKECSALLGYFPDEAKPDDLSWGHPRMFFREDMNSPRKPAEDFFQLDPQAAAIPVPEQVFCDFSAMAGQRRDASSEDQPLPHMERGRERDGVALMAGDLVFYETGPGGTVSRISVSQIWRDFIKRDGRAGMLGLFDFIEAEDPDFLPFHAGRRRISPAEALFGFVEGRDTDQSKPAIPTQMSYASRVVVNFGRLLPQDRPVLGAPVMLKELSSPKPPCECFYFHQIDGDTRKAWTGPTKTLNLANARANGRKMPLHLNPVQERGEPWKSRLVDQSLITEANVREAIEQKTGPLSRDSEETARKNVVTPILPGTKFRFTVEVENVTQAELALLIYCLRPEDTFRHKLGMGRSLGLGTVHIEPTAWIPMDPAQRYRAETFQLFSGGLDQHHDEDVVAGAGLPQWLANLGETYGADLRRALPRTATALELIGRRPGRDEPIVASPFLGDAPTESEGYAWFMANKKAWARQGLQPIAADDTRIQPLTSDPQSGGKAATTQKGGHGVGWNGRGRR